MPSNYTEHYNLSQWERADKVQMEDFNADNARIDAAFLNHPSAELILSETVAEEKLAIEWDVSDIDWDRYLMVILFAESKTSNGFQFFFNAGLAECVSIYSNGGIDHHGVLGYTNATNHMGMIIPVLYNGSHPQIAVGAGYSVSSFMGALTGGGASAPLSECKTLSTRRTNGLLQPGDKVEFWGVK